MSGCRRVNGFVMLKASGAVDDDVTVMATIVCWYTTMHVWFTYAMSILTYKVLFILGQKCLHKDDQSLKVVCVGPVDKKSSLVRVMA